MCSCCHQPFNDTDAQPKLLTCRHYFCLKCVNSVLLKTNEVYCVHCWKRTGLALDHTPASLPTNNAILYLAQNLSMLNMKPKAPDKPSVTSVGGGATSLGHNSMVTNATANNNHHLPNGCKIKRGENCHTHAMPNTLWCFKCNAMICRACAGAEEHCSHTVKTQQEAKDTIRGDISSELLNMQSTLTDVHNLVLKQRDFLLKILEACTALKTQIETELINHLPTLEIAEMRDSLGKTRICLAMIEQQTPAEAYKLYATLLLEKQRLHAKHQEMYIQCKLDDLIRSYPSLFDFELMKQALTGLHNDTLGTLSMNGSAGHSFPVLLLSNYCISQLYSRHVLANKHAQQHILNNSNGLYGSIGSNSTATITSVSNEPKTFAEIAGSNKAVVPNHNNNYLTDSMLAAVTNGSHSGSSSSTSSALRHNSGSSTYDMSNGLTVPITMMQHLQHSSQQQMSVSTTLVQSPQSSSSMICNPSAHVYPIYYFNIEINGVPSGRILIEVRNDVAPKMAKNFGALATGEVGFGYKGCQIFQCWENESIITGDFELNNGRGGRSVFEDGFFMPDDTKILAIRGSVGMRRSQKRHDNMGLVGSQFRIILREMRGFTGIFAFVVDGLELVEKISQTGDSAGKPQSSVIIVGCGKLQ